MTMLWGNPTAFPTVPFRRVFQPIRRPVPPEAEIVTAYTDGVVTLRSNRRLDGYHEAQDLSTYQGVEPGDFVVHGLDILRGSVGVSDSSGAMSPVCNVLQAMGNHNPYYHAYVIQAQAASGLTRALARGIREGGADFRRWETLAELPLLAPPAELQDQIVYFLDRETQRIDSARQEIQSLEQAFIERSQAMQRRILLADGGDSWRPIWSCVSLNTDTLPEDTDADFAFKYIDISSVSQDGMSDLESVAFGSAPSRARRIVRAGDVIVSTVRTYLRAVAAMPDSLDGAVASTGFAVLRPLPAAIDGRYLRYWCMTDDFLSEVVARSYGVSYPAINASELVRLRMPLPSMDRQVEIVAELEALERRTLEQRRHLIRLDSLLSERRQALIAAAVTGQLDVEAVA